MISSQRCSVPFSASSFVYSSQLLSCSGENVGNMDMLLLGHLVIKLDLYISRNRDTVYLLTSSCITPYLRSNVMRALWMLRSTQVLFMICDSVSHAW